MSRIVMPKHSASEFEILSTLKVYYQSRGWLDNDTVTKELKQIIGAGQYHSSYTKKCQVLCYFGFIAWFDILDRRSKKKITDKGCRLYEALISKDQASIDRLLVDSLQTVDFGKNNCGAPSSDSTLQPPVLAIRLILDLNHINYREFAYALWTLDATSSSYEAVVAHIRQSRSVGTLQMPSAARIFADAKPLMMLERWGFFVKVQDGISLSSQVLALYEPVLRGMSFVKAV